MFTTTGLYTSNVYSTYTVGTTTETAVSANTFVSTTDTIPKPPKSYGCEFDWLNITISPGTSEVTGTIGPPSSKIDFFIMNQNQEHDFKQYTECGEPIPYLSAEVAVYGLTSTYSLDWTNPPAGWYYFIFFNEALGLNTVTVVTPFVLVATYNELQTSTVYNVVTNQVTGSATQTVTSLQVTQVAPGIGSGLNSEIIAGIIIAVLVVIAALYFIKSRPKPEGGARVWEKQRATVTQRRTGDKAFCLECGKPLPVGSKFCNKCGAAQE
jgi:hypothetical protein